MSSKIIIAGYYGHGNWGDEASLATLLQIVPAEEAWVLSARPEWTHAQYGVKAVPRMQIKAVYRALRNASALLLGGGSLLQDATSLRSLLYYVTLIRWGMQFSRGVALVGQGVGPLRRSLSKRLVRWALRDIPLITVRDPDSALLLQSLGLTQPIEVYADLTWALEADSHQPPSSSPTLPLSHSPIPLIGLAPRAWRDAPIQEIFTGFARWLVEQGFTPVLVPMQESEDRPLCEEIARRAAEQIAVVPEPAHVREMLSLFGSFSAVVAVRLHAAIFAARMGVPVLTFAYDPKVVALSTELELPPPLRLEAKGKRAKGKGRRGEWESGRIGEGLQQSLQDAWQTLWVQHEAWVKRLNERVPTLSECAARCLQRVREFLE